MTLRLPPELDAQLERLAAERHTSKHALIVEATDRFARQHDRTDRVLAAVDEIASEYSETITRLEDA